jgi:hypothetical protein
MCFLRLLQAGWGYSLADAPFVQLAMLFCAPLRSPVVLAYPSTCTPNSQTRGKFGLGAKMALIWSKMTTGLPFSITSALRRQDFRSQYELDIDIHK